MRRIADERQENEISRVEHFALWTLFWLLVASIPVQLLLFREPLVILSECISVLVVSIIILISFIKRGLWGRHTNPSLKTHLFSGLLTAVIGTSIIAVLVWGKDYFLYYIFLCFVILFMVAFALSYTFGVMIRKREQKLADENDEHL